MRALAGAGLALICAALAGCGGGGGSAVEGAVTYDGTPVKAGAISFIAADTKGGGSGGAAIVDGTYKIPGEPGLKPGKYKVEIRWAKPTGKKFKSESGDMLDMTEEGLPEKYHIKSELTAEVTSGPNKIDFTLAK
ncbi:hypothetical protein GobsT_09300 [Gemmata obscuriglobus]|uniref:Carboxypeptidase regulatory-like domain-containing protein n=1 Tax=Gemmata obscuriglobus TaxID=114 RepID=A0A2Z3HFH5_9BACT|nr:hypothetical protein [Gemmata obscuriglobus]AWM40554.1 hypothetical protein C1280_28610 [Gemmata obscuriglobus]QEG26191.1 hypothetical protein GobsT_09300 [Gemmata obscuriglobus]VTS00859.1 Uncharacterized protein OS=Planctomyces maris DSM 8797 GN=PM8797T_14921 PE=4 SV=1 [Gemmata obscuriglobus UQM 2246]